MIEQGSDLEQRMRSAAGLAIVRCAQGLLTVDRVVREVREECNRWEGQACEEQEDNDPPQTLLNRLALRYCSRELYLACCSPHTDIRNCAFENLNRYLQHSLQHSMYAPALSRHMDAAEDTVQQTLIIVQRACTRHPPEGPDDPAAFLKWTQTILLRQAYAFVTENQQEETISLDTQSDTLLDCLQDQSDHDPEAHFDLWELKHALKHAILSLSNLRYQQVLFGTFLAGMEERELAALMKVEVQEVYLWRHRALKALRGKREVAEALRAWLR